MLMKHLALQKIAQNIQNPSEPQNTPQNTPRILSWNQNIDTEYDRRKVPPYNGNDPRSPLLV